MSYALAKWYDATAILWKIEIQSDEGAYVDFNAEVWDEATGYGTGLLALPTITIRAESTGRQVFVDSISPLVMVNAPTRGGTRGLFSLPISPSNPVYVGTRSFTGWKNRRVRIGVTAQNNALGMSSDLGDFLIDDLFPTGNRTAQIELISMIELLRSTSAETVREAGLPYRGKSLRFLLSQLIHRAYPTANVQLPATITVPDFPTERASSWGQSPGDLSSVDYSAQRWVVTATAKRPGDIDEVVIGYQVAGGEARPGGGLAFFNVLTGYYNIIADPGTDGFDEAYPISIEPHPTGGGFSAFLVNEAELTADTDPFWQVREARFDSDGLHTGTSNPYPFWPARETWRKGVPNDSQNNDSTRYRIGYAIDSEISQGQYGNRKWWGEPIVIPFPQMIDSAAKELFGPDDEDYPWELYAYWHVYQPGDRGPDSHETYKMSVDICEVGAYSALVRKIELPMTNAAYVRYYLATAISAAPVAWDSVVFYIEDRDGNQGYSLAMRPFPDIDGGGWSLAHFTFGTSLDQWAHQITAFVPAPNRTTFSGWIATLDFGIEDFFSDEIPWAASSLWFISGAGTLGASPIWQEAPPSEGATSARCIVDLYIGKISSTSTSPGWIAVILDRIDLSKPCYGVMVGWTTSSSTTPGVYTLLGEQGYNGPVSGRPFTGFTVIEASLAILHVRFYDQANGQVHEAIINPSGVTFSVVNSAEPVHTREQSVSCDRGVYLTASDGVERSLIGCAPGPIGDVLWGHWQRPEKQPALVRHLRGYYPLIQISQSRTGIIEVADFDEMSCLDAVERLLELAPGHSLLPPSGDDVTVQTEEAGSPVVYLRDVAEVGVVDPVKANEWPVLNGPKLQPRVLYSELRTAVEVVPHEFVPAGKAEGLLLKAAGSTFGGTFIWDVGTERAGSVVLEAVHGSSPVTDDSTGLRQGAALFRWRSLLETITAYATAAAHEAAVSIYCGGLRREGGRYFAGDVDISAGGQLKVKDGPIVGFTPTAVTSDGGAVRLDLESAVGVDVGAFAEVEINPTVAESASDGPDGITRLAAVIGGGSSDSVMGVVSTLDMYTGMILRVGSEFVEILEITQQSTPGQIGLLSVGRGYRNSKIHPHGINIPVQGYVSIRKPYQLYPVGQTGVLFGIAFDRDLEKAERTLTPGDGVRITTTGYALKPMRHAMRRRVSSTAEARYLRGEGDRSTLTGTPNPFIDLAASGPIADARLAEGASPPYQIDGIEIPFLPILRNGDTVAFQSSILPTDEETLFRIVSIEHEGESNLTILTIRAFDSWEEINPIAADQPNPGFSGDPAPAITETQGAPRGQRGGHRRTT